MWGRAASLDGITIEAVSVPAGFHLRGHEHESAHLCTVVGGSFGELRQQCSAGTTRISPAGDRHRIAFGDRGAECLLVIAPQTWRERVFHHNAWTWELARQAWTELRGEADPLTLESLGYELMSRGHRADSGPPPLWLRRVRDALHGGVQSIGALAADAGVSREHLARAFRAHFGTNPGAFSRRARVAAACRALCSTDATIAGIAAEFGFADQSHFTRACVTVNGISPGKLRELRRSAKITFVQDFGVGPG